MGVDVWDGQWTGEVSRDKEGKSGEGFKQWSSVVAHSPTPRGCGERPSCLAVRGFLGLKIIQIRRNLPPLKRYLHRFILYSLRGH